MDNVESYSYAMMNMGAQDKEALCWPHSIRPKSGSRFRSPTLIDYFDNRKEALNIKAVHRRDAGGPMMCFARGGRRD